MLEASVNKLLHEPATQLKAAANHPQAPLVAQTVSQLFGLRDAGADADDGAEPSADAEPTAASEEGTALATCGGTDAPPRTTP
jgi:hypothetical protein